MSGSPFSLQVRFTTVQGSATSNSQPDVILNIAVLFNIPATDDVLFHTITPSAAGFFVKSNRGVVLLHKGAFANPICRTSTKPSRTLRDRGRPGSLYEHMNRRKDITMDIGIIGAGRVAHLQRMAREGLSNPACADDADVHGDLLSPAPGFIP